MTFWLDAQLHPELAAWLGSNFKVVALALKEIQLHRATDIEIYNAARRFNEIVIITKDEDFVELIERKGAPPQLVWLSVGNLTKIELQIVLRKSFAQALEKLESGAAMIEISR
ncbi:MAG: DUF5615 family PIN-like protein [Phycisphaerae bacterium]|nr:DUF5615 family PIN-like protein [Phycisphaerae bacterium]